MEPKVISLKLYEPELVQVQKAMNASGMRNVSEIIRLMVRQFQCDVVFEKNITYKQQEEVSND